MVEKTESCKVVPFGAWDAVVAVGIDGEAAAGEEFAPYFNISGAEETDEVFHDHVDAVFMEVAVVTVAEEVKFQGFAFYQVFVWNEGNVNGSKIRLACFRAEAGEFRAVEFYEEVLVRVFVWNSFQKAWIIVKCIGCMLAAKMFQFIKAFSFFCHNVPRINKIRYNLYKDITNGKICK